MREIKFREWETERKTMVVGNREDYDDSVGFRFEHEEGGQRILMQYTGLKDKNGVEIYEGDIVNVTFEGSHFFNSEVKWFGDKGYPSFDIEAPRTFYFDSNVLSCISNVSEYEIEVIGNKFDNPELLEGN